MTFKRTFCVLAILFCWVTAQGLDKWNIFLANLRDLSRAKDKTTGMTVQKSLASQFQKQTAFKLIQPRTNVVIDSFQTALNAGRAYKADVILYGDYFIEGEDLVIVIDVFDVLENRLKMRKYYSGAVDLDIFDTIDSMSADMVKKIKEVLPEMTEESQMKIRQVRQNIYETEKVSIKRMFYTRLGFHTELGPKQLHVQKDSGSYDIPNDITGGQYYFSNIPIGFAIRLWDFRFDLLVSGLPGVPFFPWQNSDYTYERASMDNIYVFQFSYYLPWFNNSVAVSVGAFSFDYYTKLNFDTNNKKVNSDTRNYPGFSMAFGAIWNINPDLELSLFFNPFMSSENNKAEYNDSGVYQGTNYQKFWRDFPALSLDAIYFLGNFGLELRASADSYHFRSYILNDNGTTNYSYSDGDVYVNSMIVSLYVGFVYRVDFLK